MGSFAWGQTCPTGCSLLSSGNTYTNDLVAPDCSITITYDVYDCGGFTSIRMTGYTATGSCTAMTNFSIYHYNISSLEEYLSLALLEYYADIVTGPAPNCPASSQTVKIYTAQCGIWVGCEYEVNPDPAKIICDNGYQDPKPHYGSSPTKVKVYKWQSCGTICCENVYNICRTNSPSSGIVIRTMNKISSGPQGGSTCSGEAAYSPLTCQNGCM
jgi:hypothetical protein